jgi:hypothetical protein
MPQDFSGQNLRGRSFKGQNLAGANFSDADIRGADFTDAILRGTNFSNAKGGLQKGWASFLVCVSWLLSGISGFFLAITGGLIVSVFNSSTLETKVSGWTALVVALIGAVALAFAFTVALVVALALALDLAGAFSFAVALALAVTGSNAIL